MFCLQLLKFWVAAGTFPRKRFLALQVSPRSVAWFHFMVMKRKSWLQKHRAWLKNKKSFEKASKNLRRMTQHIGDIELLPPPAPASAIETERMLVEWSLETAWDHRALRIARMYVYCLKLWEKTSTNGVLIKNDQGCCICEKMKLQFSVGQRTDMWSVLSLVLQNVFLIHLPKRPVIRKEYWSDREVAALTIWRVVKDKRANWLKGHVISSKITY